MVLFSLDKKAKAEIAQRAMQDVLRCFSEFVEQYNAQIGDVTPLRIAVEEQRAATVSRVLVMNSFHVVSFYLDKGWIRAHLFRSGDLLRSARQETVSNLKLALQVVARPNDYELRLDNDEPVKEELPVLLLSLFEEFVRKSQSIAQSETTPRVQLNGQSIATAVRHLVNERNNALAELLTQNEKIHNQIARDLHDSVISDLMLLKQNIEKGVDVEEQAEVVQDAINTLRDLCSGLSSRELQDWGLLPTLRNFVQKTRRKTEVVIDLVAPDVVPNFQFEINLHIFRIVQESINNALKHSGCDRVAITLNTQSSNTFSISVEDNGKSPVEYIRPGGLGSFILNERVALINETLPAELSVRSNSTNGTTVALTIQTPREVS